MRAVVGLILGLVGCAREEDDGPVETWTFEDIDALYFEVDTGTVVVRSASDGTSRVDLYDGYSSMSHFLLPPKFEGQGRFEVWIPKGVDLDVTLESGEVDIALDAKAELDVCVGTGDVYIDLPAGGYALDVHAGTEIRIGPRIEDDPSSKYGIRVCAGIGSVEIE